MNIIKKQNGSELLFELSGSIDTTTAPELDKAISGSIQGIKSLIFDFKNVDYVSSAGLRVLLVAYKTMSNQGEMIIRHVNQNVMDVFTMTGFDNFLVIEN